jgi:hypothetical protein
MFHPFKYKYLATYLKDEGHSALIKVSAGTCSEELLIPKTILPKEVQIGQNFSVCLQPEDTINESEEATMKKLLTELIR